MKSENEIRSDLEAYRQELIAYSKKLEEWAQQSQKREEIYNQVVGSVGYVCLFLVISTDSFTSNWSRFSLLSSLFSLLIFVAWTAGKMHADTPEKLKKYEKNSPLHKWVFGLSRIFACLGGLFIVLAKFV